MRKYIKFYILAAALSALPCYIAATNDTFTTGLSAFPAVLFFLSSLIISLIKTFRKEERKYHLIKAISSLVLILSLIIPIKLSDRGMGELTKKRIQIINGLEPVFVKYLDEKGHYPKTLQDLIPDYMQAIPNELINHGIDDPYKKISYALEKGQPIFYFRTHRGPDSGARLNVITGEYRHDE
jgi:hypothetical protein